MTSALSELGMGFDQSGRFNAEPSGTRRASAEPLSRRLLPPFACAPVRWSATPPGAACARRIAHERGAPVRPAPARHAVRPLRSRPASRARPGQTGGDPAAPIGFRRASTAARTNAAGRRVAAAGAAGLGSRSFVALGRAAWPPAARNRGLAQKSLGGEPAGQ